MEPKKYLIATLADIRAIPKEKRAALLKDLALWLDHGDSFDAMIQGMPEELRSRIVRTNPNVMVWLDDGKNNAIVTVEVRNSK